MTNKYEITKRLMKLDKEDIAEAIDSLSPEEREQLQNECKGIIDFSNRIIGSVRKQYMSLLKH